MANRQPAGSGGTQNGGRGGGGGGRGRGTGMPGNMPYNPGQYGQRPGAYLPQQAYGMMPGYQYVQQQQQGMQAYGVPQAMQYAGYQVPGSTSRQPFRQPQPTVVYQQQNGAQPAEVAAAKPAPTKQAPKKKSKAIRIVNPDTKKDVVVETPAGAVASATDSSVSAATATTTATASPAAGTPGSTRKSKAIKIQRPDNGEVKTSPPATTPAATVAATAASATAPKKEAEAGAPSTAVAPASAAPRAAPTASGADAPAASEEKAGAGPPPKAPAPAENQWTPSNTAGEKSYSHAFMSAFRTVCKASPPSFRDDIEVIMANPASRGGNGGKGGNFKSGPDWMQNGFSQQSGGFRPPQRNGSNNGRRGAPSRNDGRGGPQQPRAGQKVINLPGRNREAPKLQKSENAFVISTKKKTGIEKDTFKEITVRLNKLTLEKFDILALQIKDLLVADLEKVQELVMGIFVKAIDEEFFSMIYAKLCKYLAIAVSTDDGNVEAIPMFRKTLLNCCQQEFEKATKADAAAAKLDASKKEAAAAAEKAAAEAGIETKELSKEEAAKKREEEREEGYARNKVKRHMLGNIRFIGELFKEDLVSSKIMMHCINHLVPNKNAEEENLENLCKLLETAGGKWETQMLKAKKNKKQTAENEATVKRTFATLKELTNRAGLSSRIKFAVLDILDLRDRKWKPRTEAKGPKTISEVHAEANLEQIKIQQQSGGRSGGGGGRGGSGGGRRGRDNYAAATAAVTTVVGSAYSGGGSGGGAAAVVGAAAPSEIQEEGVELCQDNDAGKSNWSHVLRYLVDAIRSEHVDSFRDGRTTALIDAGAMMAGKTNVEVAEHLLQNTEAKHFRGVVYFSLEHDEWRVKDHTGQDWSKDTSPIHEREAFVFFDESRCRGADMRLEHNAKAVLCLGPKMQKDKLMQAAARLRQLSRGQQITLVAPRDVDAQIRTFNGLSASDSIASNHIVSWTLLNSEGAVASWMPEWSKQGAHFCAVSNKPELALIPEVLELKALYSGSIADIKAYEAWRETETVITAESASLLHKVEERMDQFGREIEVQTATLDQECERELEKEIELEQERQLAVEAQKPREEVAWDYTALYQEDCTSAKDLPSDANVLSLAAFVKTRIKFGVDASDLALSPNLYGTHNFFESCTAGGHVNEFLRWVDAVIELPSGDVLLVSEREADSILGLMWDSEVRPFKFVSMQDFDADSSTGTRASLRLFRGQTVCPSDLQEQLKAILRGTASELVARTFVNLRGRHTSWDRSDLEKVATVFAFAE